MRCILYDGQLAWREVRLALEVSIILERLAPSSEKSGDRKHFFRDVERVHSRQGLALLHETDLPSVRYGEREFLAVGPGASVRRDRILQNGFLRDDTDNTLQFALYSMH